MVDALNRDPRVREYLSPTRVVWQTGLADPGALLAPGSGQATPWGTPGLTLRNAGRSRAAFCLDFGREIHGSLQIVVGNVKDQRPVRVRVRFGESVSEAMGEPNNDHAIHDMTVMLPFYGAAECGNTGFRFVRIDLLDRAAEVEIREIRAIAVYRDLEYKGSFSCSDERLDRIWQTGAYTVHLNLQEYVWDGIKRDRLVWLGDLHPEVMVICSAFGRLDVVERSMDLAREETPLPRFMNGISAYSLWWILVQRDWFLYQGDLTYLRQQRDYLLGLIELLEGFIDRCGRETLPPVRFIDWPNSGDEKVLHAGLQALLTMAFDAAGPLCRWLGETAASRRCMEIATRLRARNPPAGMNKQANALKALAGLADPLKTNRDVLARHPERGISTFMGYYVLQARAAAGDYQGCLDLIRKYWGAMLDLGATTFWEDFDLDWARNAGRIDEIVPEGKVDIHAERGAYCYKGLRHSLCHGWAGGPTAWLSEHVLGIKPLKPGCAELAIRPHLGDLDWAEGSFPTPMGVLRVRHERGARGKSHSEVQAPAGIRIKK